MSESCGHDASSPSVPWPSGWMPPSSYIAAVEVELGEKNPPLVSLSKLAKTLGSENLVELSSRITA